MLKKANDRILDFLQDKTTERMTLEIENPYERLLSYRLCKFYRICAESVRTPDGRPLVSHCL
jgi:hypothetical protein